MQHALTFRDRLHIMHARASCDACELIEDVVLAMPTEEPSVPIRQGAAAACMREIARRGCTHVGRVDKPS